MGAPIVQPKNCGRLRRANCPRWEFGVWISCGVVGEGFGTDAKTDHGAIENCRIGPTAARPAMKSCQSPQACISAQAPQ